MLKEGMVVTIMVEKNNQLEESKCKIQAVYDNELLVDYPVNIKTGKTIFLLNGSNIVVSFVGEDGNVYKFLSTVNGRVKQIIPLIQISLPLKETFTKIQRREYVRIDSSIDIAVHPNDNNISPFVTTTHDISAGGCAINVPLGKKLLSNTNSTLWLTLIMNSSEIHHLKVEGNIVRVFDGLDQTRKRASVQFTSMKEVDRDKIIKYCFEQQINSKRKTLL